MGMLNVNKNVDIFCNKTERFLRTKRMRMIFPYFIFTDSL